MEPPLRYPFAPKEAAEPAFRAAWTDAGMGFAHHPQTGYGFVLVLGGDGRGCYVRRLPRRLVEDHGRNDCVEVRPAHANGPLQRRCNIVRGQAIAEDTRVFWPFGMNPGTATPLFIQYTVRPAKRVPTRS